MTLEKQKSGPSMKGPSTYLIHVSGYLNEGWSSRLGGMEVIECREVDGYVETVLQGRLADQAALTGVLNALYDLHLPVISVEYLGEDLSPGKEWLKTH